MSDHNTKGAKVSDNRSQQLTPEQKEILESIPVLRVKTMMSHEEAFSLQREMDRLKLERDSFEHNYIDLEQKHSQTHRRERRVEGG